MRKTIRSRGRQLWGASWRRGQRIRRIASLHGTPRPEGCSGGRGYQRWRRQPGQSRNLRLLGSFFFFFFRLRLCVFIRPPGQRVNSFQGNSNYSFTAGRLDAPVKWRFSRVSVRNRNHNQIRAGNSLLHYYTTKLFFYIYVISTTKWLIEDISLLRNKLSLFRDYFHRGVSW